MRQLLTGTSNKCRVKIINHSLEFVLNVTLFSALFIFQQMADKDKNMYSVVEFTEAGTVQVIPTSWVECMEDGVGRLLFLK